MRKIDYSNLTLQYIKYINRKADLSVLQNNWELLRKSIIDTFVQKKYSQQFAEDVFPEKVEDIILGDFSTLNKIYNYSHELKKYEKKIAKRIFRYDFSNKEIKNPCVPNSKPELKNIKESKPLSTIISKFFMKNSELLNISSCFYCESNYINAYPTKKGKRRQFQLDHFFGKADCPITAISLYNLVPSCSICNGTSIKGKKNLYNFYNITRANKSTVIDFSPYSPTSSNYDFENHVTISVKQNRKIKKIKSNFMQNSKNFHIEFKSDSIIYENEIKAFFLEERYNYENTKKEALNLLELKQKFPASYISLISKTLSNNKIYLSPDEIEEAIFHKRADKKSHRVFGKMKDDILK